MNFNRLMPFLFVFILCLAPNHCLLGQTNKNAFDYLVNAQGDTIYGIVKDVGSKKMYLKQKVSINNKGEILYKEHTSQGAKSFRHNDKIYNYSKPKEKDGIYADASDNDYKKGYVTERQGAFIFEQKLLPDYVVTNQNDTIYGEIKKSLIKREQLRDSSDQKIVIKGKSIKAYRKENEVFEYKHVEPRNTFDFAADLYLKLLISHPKVKLYERTEIVDSPMFNNIGSMGMGYTKKYVCYYLEKDGKLFNLKLKKKYLEELSEILTDQPDLVSLIQAGFYEKEDIYLIVKYYCSKTD